MHQWSHTNVMCNTLHIIEYVVMVLTLAVLFYIGNKLLSRMTRRVDLNLLYMSHELSKTKLFIFCFSSTQH